MRRIYFPNGTCNFEFYYWKKERQLVREAHIIVDKAHWRFADMLSMLAGECRKANTADLSYWCELKETIDTVLQLISMTNLDDPPSKEHDEDRDYECEWGSAAIMLYNLFSKFQFHLPSTVCMKRLLENRSGNCKIVKIHNEILDEALSLYKTLAEVFCKLCAGDTLFTKALGELNGFGVLPTSKNQQKKGE